MSGHDSLITCQEKGPQGHPFILQYQCIVRATLGKHSVSGFFLEVVSGTHLHLPSEFLILLIMKLSYFHGDVDHLNMLNTAHRESDKVKDIAPPTPPGTAALSVWEGKQWQ